MDSIKDPPTYLLYTLGDGSHLVGSFSGRRVTLTSPYKIRVGKVEVNPIPSQVTGCQRQGWYDVGREWGRRDQVENEGSRVRFGPGVTPRTRGFQDD